jgi:hypothetical protein
VKHRASRDGCGVADTAAAAAAAAQFLNPSFKQLFVSS